MAKKGRVRLRGGWQIFSVTLVKIENFSMWLARVFKYSSKFVFYIAYFVFLHIVGKKSAIQGYQRKNCPKKGAKKNSEKEGMELIQKEGIPKRGDNSRVGDRFHIPTVS